MKLNRVNRGAVAGLVGITLGLSSLFSSSAKASTFEIPIFNKFYIAATGEELNDDFYARVRSDSSDGYDLGDDILNPPPFPGDFVDLTTLVDGNELMVDSMAPIFPFSSKRWELDLTLGNPIAPSILSGNNNISWDLIQVPLFYELHLRDYGTDLTRTSLIDGTNMRDVNSYEFFATGLGIVRYLSLDVTNNFPEPSSLAVLGAVGAGYLMSRRRR